MVTDDHGNTDSWILEMNRSEYALCRTTNQGCNAGVFLLLLRRCLCLSLHYGIEREISRDFVGVSRDYQLHGVSIV